MYVKTTVSYDGKVRRSSDLSLKRGARRTGRAFLYVCLVLGIAVAVYQLFAGGLIPEKPKPMITNVVEVSACDWLQGYNRTLDDLGENGSAWSVTMLDGAWGRAYPESLRVEISPHTTCDQVHETIKHEYIHLQQFRAKVELNGRGEIIADCGAKILGGTYFPYIDPQYPEFQDTCTANDDEWAQWLIDWNGDA